MNILRTQRTYSTPARAEKHLADACKDVGVTIENVRFVIAVNELGRFAPVVLRNAQEKDADKLFDLIHSNVTVCG